MIKRFAHSLARNSSVKDMVVPVVTVAGGRAFGQAIVFLSTLFAAKYFSPADFGAVGLFTSLAALGGAASGLRLETRAQVSKHPRTRAAFFGMAYLSNLIIFLLLYLIVAIKWALFDSGLSAQDFLLPCAIFATSLSLYIIPAQNTSPANPKLVGLMAQVSASVVATVQVLSAIFLPIPALLAAARTAGPVLGSLVAFKSVREALIAAASLPKRTASKLLRTSIKEIIYGIPANALSTVAMQIPIYLFSYYGLNDSTGVYWLAFNMMFTPYIVLSASLRPIYLAKIMEKKPSRRTEYIFKSTIAAFLGGALAVTSISIIGSFVAATFLPADWGKASSYVLWLSPMLVGLVAATPLTAATAANRQQGLNLLYTTAQVVIRAVAVAIPLQMGLTDIAAVAAFSISSAFVTLIYVFIAFTSLRKRRSAFVGAQF